MRTIIYQLGECDDRLQKLVEELEHYKVDYLITTSVSDILKLTSDQFCVVCTSDEMQTIYSTLKQVCFNSNAKCVLVIDELTRDELLSCGSVGLDKVFYWNELYKLQELYDDVSFKEVDNTPEHSIETRVNDTPSVLYTFDYVKNDLIEGKEDMARMFGYELSDFDLMEQGIHDPIHPNDLHSVLGSNKTLKQNQKEALNNVTFRYRTKAGVYRWLELNSRIFEWNEQGKPVKEIGVIMDITDRNKTFDLFRSVSNLSTAGVCIVRNNKVLYSNHASNKITCYTAYEFNKLNFYDLVSDQKVTELIEELCEYGDDKSTHRLETVFYSRAGREINVDVSLKPIVYKGHKAALIFFLDITRLTEALVTYRNLVNHSDDLIYILNKEFEFIGVNNAVVNKYGYSEEEIIGQTPVFLGADGQNNMESVVRSMNDAWNGSVVCFDWVAKRKNGSFFMKELVIQKGKYFGEDVLVAFGRDLTDRKKQEEEKNNLIVELQRKNKDLQEFSYIVSHNMRSPIVAIMGLIEILDSSTLSEENLEVVRLINESIRNLDGIIYDLNKTISVRHDNSTNQETFKFDDVVSSVCQSLRHMIDGTNMNIERDYDDGVEIYSIKSYIQNILFNFINNGIKYRDQKKQGQITVRLRKGIDYLLIEVEDNGIGMHLEKYGDRLFNMYERFHTHIQGKGLGLYLVHEQVVSLNGHIEVDSAVGRGSKFSVRLPIL